MTRETSELIKKELALTLGYEPATMYYQTGKAKFTVWSGHDAYGRGLKEAKEAEKELQPLVAEIARKFNVEATLKRLRYQGFLTFLNIVAE